jgi:hypothetical protein
MSIKEKPHRKYYVLEGEAVLCGPAARTRTWINSLEGYCTIPCTTASETLLYYRTYSTSTAKINL